MCAKDNTEFNITACSLFVTKILIVCFGSLTDINVGTQIEILQMSAIGQ